MVGVLMRLLIKRKHFATSIVLRTFVTLENIDMEKDNSQTLELIKLSLAANICDIEKRVGNN